MMPGLADMVGISSKMNGAWMALAYTIATAAAKMATWKREIRLVRHRVGDASDVSHPGTSFFFPVSFLIFPFPLQHYPAARCVPIV